MKWKDKLLSDLISVLEKDDQNMNYADRLRSSEVSIHLAIFTEPFLTYLLDGKKTFESRLSIHPIAPYGKITKNDLVVVKKSGEDIYGIFTVKSVLFSSNLKSEVLKRIDEKYGEKIMWNALDFFQSKSAAKYLTLVEVSELHAFAPFDTLKKDRGSWIVIRKGLSDTLFEKQTI